MNINEQSVVRNLKGSGIFQPDLKGILDTRYLLSYSVSGGKYLSSRY